MRRAKRAQVPASSKLGTICQHCSASRQTSPLERMLSNNLLQSEQTSAARRVISEKHRLVSCAVDVSLVVSPWSAGWRLPPYPPLSCDVELLASQIHDNTHIYANISWRVESSGEAVRELNRCYSMHDGGAVYHDVDLGPLSTSAGALLCRIPLN
jgi:hypothetical protein